MDNERIFYEYDLSSIGRYQIPLAFGKNGEYILFSGSTINDYKLALVKAHWDYVSVEEQPDKTSGNTIYPNPADDYITISGMTDPTGRIDIYTLAGVKIISAAGPRVDVSHLAPGFYIVRAEDKSLKFVKM